MFKDHLVELISLRTIKWSMGYMNKDNIFTFVQYACEGHKSNKLGEQTI